MGFFRLTLPVVPTVLHTQDMRLKTYYTKYTLFFSGDSSHGLKNHAFSRLISINFCARVLPGKALILTNLPHEYYRQHKYNRSPCLYNYLPSAGPFRVRKMAMSEHRHFLLISVTRPRDLPAPRIRAVPRHARVRHSPGSIHAPHGRRWNRNLPPLHHLPPWEILQTRHLRQSA